MRAAAEPWLGGSGSWAAGRHSMATLIRVGSASEREERKRERERDMAILPGDREGFKPNLQIPRLKYFRVM